MTTPVHLLPRGQSWGEDLQIYKSSKAVLPWRPELQQPVRHITRHEKSREEREYDLILAQYRDVQREASTRDKEIKQQKQALIDAKVKQSRYVQKFNLINHHTAEPEPVESALRPPNTRVGYNIVNHRDLEVLPLHEAPPDHNGKKMVESKHLGRPFSVISNKYHSNHDERSQVEAMQQREAATIKFNKTHDYNPLLVRYYDSKKEEKFLAEREAQDKVHGLGRDDALPHGEQYCASRLYNLVNHKVLRPEKFEAVTNVGNRRLNCMKSSQINKAVHERSEALEDLTLVRSLNRISHERVGQAYVHGYDPLTNQPFDGRLRKARVPLRTQPKPHVWARLEGPSNNQSEKHSLPAINSSLDRKPLPGMNPIEPEILFISHDKPIDPGGASVAPSPMTKPPKTTSRLSRD